MPKINNLLKGKTIQINPSEIENYVAKIPNMSDANFKKLNKAYKNNRGCRCSFDDNELVGSGFASMAKKGAKAGAKAIKNNKQLSKLKDQAINQGLNYAVNQAGLDENTGALVKSLGSNLANRQFDQLAGGSMFNKKLGRNILKNSSKALKIGNKISNAMGYDDLDNMAIDFATQQTLGRIDPTLGNMASKQLNRLADKQIEKHGGNINPYLPKQLQGGSLSSGRTHNYEVYDNLSNEVQVNHQAFNPDMYLDPMFDQLKLIRQQAQLGLSGSGFRVNM
jgi:hypothetical protein